ncbi:M1 family aminopeptidase [Mangrovimonas xylaniphaga]|uniref:M1 family aminopeptidase n=1 Tax=Mangrovimonas xylaniphaga TaxID=1645915 RepID=UPI0006B531CE|nr:M1 family aminopeptidase [Mangrovimonas xylaniphaga]
MKRFLPLYFFLGSIMCFAQDFDATLKEISTMEAKAALTQLMSVSSVNTGNYDLKYHRLEFTVDPQVAFIEGEVTTYFEAKETLTQIYFDLVDDMVVTEVLKNGVSQTFTQDANDELVITLSETINAGVLDSLTISYSGNPENTGLGAFEQSSHNGDPIIWTLSEPYGAKGWWPCKQDLNDKADSLDVFITTPKFNPNNEAYIAVANGVEQSQVLDTETKTTHFKHRYPIPAYLVAMAVTNYEVYNHTVENNGAPFDIVNYVYPENLASAQVNTEITVDIMELFTELFEEYPFAIEKYGHAQFGWSGGMEHTTVSFMGSFGRNLIAHELAHQWFGDKITCGSWKDIWLNEGFATYLSGLVIEDMDEPADFVTWKAQRVNSITSLPDGAVYLSDADTLNVNRIFSSRLSYNKGAMVLHMLRKKVGDTDFYQGLTNYLADEDHAYAYAKTVDFIEIMETATGEDLTEFFNDWVYNEGYPTYTLNCSQPTETTFEIEVNQIQSDPSVSFFEAPVPVRLIGTEGEVLDLVLDNTSNGQVFTELVDFTVSEVLFDPESDLISKNDNVTLGVADLALASQLRLYPNPTNAVLYIEKPDNVVVEQVDVYNPLGQLVLKSTETSSIDLTPYSIGMFFVKLTTNKGIINKSVLKN